MSEPVISPSPWSVDEQPFSAVSEDGTKAIPLWCVKDAKGCAVAHLPAGDDSLYNARLMAKAPVMLGMLQRMIGYSENGVVVGFYPYDGVIEDFMAILKYIKDGADEETQI